VLQFGFGLGFLSAEDGVELALERLKAQLSLNPAERDLALTLSDDIESATRLLAVSGGDMEAAADVWAFAGLTSVVKDWSSLAKPWETVAAVVSVTGASSRYRALTYYAPVPWWRPAPRHRGLAVRMQEILREDSLKVGRARYGDEF